MVRTMMPLIMVALWILRILAQTDAGPLPRDLGSAEVTIVQQLLVTLGYDASVNDGSWTSQTETAIESFASDSKKPAVRTNANALFAALISAHVVKLGSDPKEVQVVRQYIPGQLSLNQSWQQTNLTRDLFVTVKGVTIAHYREQVPCEVRFRLNSSGLVVGFETRCPDDPASKK